MNIIEIVITNTKKLKAFKKTLGGKNMEVAGDTATGKTTAISALWDIIEKAGDALTHGEKKGGIRVVLGDGEQSIIAERTFTDKSSTISLTKYDAAGKPIETISAADFKNMLSKLSVNPHKIMGMGPTERVRTLMAAADTDIDLEALDAKIKQREEERLTAFRRMESIEPGEEPVKAQAVSTQELLQERNQILFHNDRNDKVRRECDDLTVEARSIHISLGACNEEIIAMEEALRIKKREWVELTAKEKELQGKISTSQSVIKGLEDKSTVAIDEKLSTIDETNKKAAAHSHWVAETKRYEEAKEAHLEIFRDAKYLQDKKAKALEGAKWPLDGLTIEDGKVLFNGSTLENLGESEQMLVTSALAVADIEKHPLKVVRMDGVESMSKADFEKLQALFNGRGIQVLSTRVSRGEVEPQELVIVDGIYDENGDA